MNKKQNYNNLYAFYVVSLCGNFTAAAKKLGITQSALSHTIKDLEERLKIKLFNRTTRTLSLTQAGEQLFLSAKKSFDELDYQLELLNKYHKEPVGVVRIVAALVVINSVLLPRLKNFNQKYPNIVIELYAEAGFSDIIAQKFDAGVRVGEDLQEGMIATKISNEFEMALVCSQDYAQKYGIPKNLEELNLHNCIVYRYGTGELADYTLQIDNKLVDFKPNPKWIFNDSLSVFKAVELGLGIAYSSYDLVKDEIKKGNFIRLFPEYSIKYDGLYLYYPHRELTKALRVVIDELKINS